MTISIVTPFLNGSDLLPDYEAATMGAELIIVDNGSAEETATALQSLPPERGKVIRNETNAGFAAANNQGYAAASGDVIVFLNSDVAGDAAWLKLVADDVKDGALYGPSLAQQFVGGRWLPYLEGWCIAATRATWERLSCTGSGHIKHGKTIGAFQGPWDQCCYPGPYWEDNDLCFRALQQNIALVQTTWPVQHKGGRTAGALIRHAASLEANRATFTARVLATEPPAALTPTYAAYMQHVHTQSDIQHHLPLLNALARGNVLELGTRTGVSTAALLAGVERAGGHVWSVDIDDCSAIAAGHPHWTFAKGDSRYPERLWDYETEFGGQLDLILIDTEHVLEVTLAELEAWEPYLKESGYICLHDTETFPGVRRAIEIYCATRPELQVSYVLPCNGMGVIRKFPKSTLGGHGLGSIVDESIVLPGIAREA